MSTKDHVHKLKRHTYKNGSTIYFCVLDCTFKVSCNLSLGKHAICWRCGKPFSLNAYSITLAKPHCEECHQYTGVKPKKKLKDLTLTPVVIQETPTSAVLAETANDVVSSMRDKLASVAMGSVTYQPERPTPEFKVVEFKTIEPDEEDLI